VIRELPPEQRVPVTHLEQSVCWKRTGMFTQHMWCGGISWAYAWKSLRTMQANNDRGRLNEAEKDFMAALEQTLIDQFLK
jgi:hypothetical protein